MEEKDSISEEQQTPPSGDESTQNGNRGKLGNGIVIFIGLNFVLWLLTLIIDDPSITVFIGWAAMLINVVVMAVLARYRRAEAGGMLGTFVVLIILTFIIAPICWLTQCFITAINSY